MFRNILFTVLSISLFSCNKPDVLSDKIKNIVELLASEKVSEEEIVKNYFLIDKDIISTYDLNCNVLKLLKTISKGKEIEILTYKKANSKYCNLYDVIGETSKVYIVHIKESPDNPYMYVLILDEKIKSITPIVKGTKIIGWM
jgi:hypothetical protein